MSLGQSGRLSEQLVQPDLEQLASTSSLVEAQPSGRAHVPLPLAVGFVLKGRPNQERYHALVASTKGCPNLALLATRTNRFTGERVKPPRLAIIIVANFLIVAGINALSRNL